MNKQSNKKQSHDVAEVKVIHSDLLRLREFCALLSISIPTGRMWVLNKKIDYVKVGRCVRIHKSEVQRILAEGFSARKVAKSA